MGYTTDFEGAVTVVPPLNEHEIAYLRRFADTRRMDPEFARFTFDHTVNGTIEAQGEDPDDAWTLTVTENVVTALYPPDVGDYVVS